MRAYTSRRDFLARAGVGFGTLALSALLADEAQAQTIRKPHYPAKAKSVIFLFMYGGPSQMDTFDPKPELTKFHGKTLQLALPNAGEVKTFFGGNSSSVPLMKSVYAFKKYGKSGIEVSDLFPHVGSCVDDICFVRSVYGTSNNHAPALFEMNTGTILQGAPSLGSWTTYGLGSENQNLPGYVVMLDPHGGPIGGAPNWASGYMPASYQGTVFRPSGVPILDLKPGEGISDDNQKQDLAFLAQLNHEHLTARPGDSDLDARIKSYELA
ncbi:DUF1501 domain-containing protein, partial [Armatimonas sp.]|uniref:DUF1501 domain-containing protein n=1 Tax=Armatimonas sp. TaxID=1872638 RepID=UPI00286B986A